MNILSPTLPGWVCAGLIACNVLIGVTSPGARVEISRDRIEAMISERLPEARRAGPFQVDIENILVDLTREDGIRLRLGAQADGPGISGLALIDLETGLSYEAGEIHLVNFALRSVQVAEGMTGPEPGSLTRDGWERLITRVMRHNAADTSPVTTLKRKVLQDSLPSLEARARARLDAEPAIDLDAMGPKAAIGRHFISDITVGQDVIEVPLTLSNKVIHGLLAVLTLLAGAGHALILRRREAGMKKPG